MEHDEVSFVSGRSRLYGIIGHPITQVRSPEMVTAEFVKRGHHGIFVPFRVEPHDFEASTRALLRMPNLDGLVFTIPYKQRAMALATRIEPNAQTVGAINLKFLYSPNKISLGLQWPRDVLWAAFLSTQ